MIVAGRSPPLFLGKFQQIRVQALGVREALNLDGGGTSAMWFGGAYKVGPGRLLPNAVILTRP